MYVCERERPLVVILFFAILICVLLEICEKAFNFWQRASGFQKVLMNTLVIVLVIKMNTGLQLSIALACPLV